MIDDADETHLMQGFVSDQQALTCDLLRDELEHFAESRLRHEIGKAHVRLRKELCNDIREAWKYDRTIVYDGKRTNMEKPIDTPVSEERDKIRKRWHLAGYSAVKEMKDIDEYEKESGVRRRKKQLNRGPSSESFETVPSLPLSTVPSLSVSKQSTKARDNVAAESKQGRKSRSPSPVSPHLPNTFESRSDALEGEYSRDKPKDVDAKPLFDEVAPFCTDGFPDGFSHVVPVPTTQPYDLEVAPAELPPCGSSDHISGIHSSKHLAQFAEEASRVFDSDAQNGGCRANMRRKVHSAEFDYIVGLLILVNSVFIGVQTDCVARNREDDRLPTFFHVIEIIFFVAFVLELIMRLIADWDRWLTMTDWQWNIFDSLLVIVQATEEVLNIFAWADGNDSGKGALQNINIMRVLRVLRLIRVIRLVRILRFIGELRTLVTSILGSLKSLAWTVLLLLLLIYSVSVYLTQVVRDDNYHEILNHFYGSLPLSMLTLFQSVTGGIDWNDAMRPLSDEIHPLLALVLGFYIAFTLLAVMNVVTGVFVESALLSANQDQTTYMVNNMRDLFLQANDGDPYGSMAWDNFVALLDKKQMREFFKAIDVDMNIDAARSIFQLLDVDKSDSLELDEFVTGCSRLRGHAKALDLNVLLLEMREMSITMRRGFQEKGREIEQLRLCLSDSDRLPTFLSLRSRSKQSCLEATPRTSDERETHRMPTQESLTIAPVQSAQPKLCRGSLSKVSQDLSASNEASRVPTHESITITPPHPAQPRLSRGKLSQDFNGDTSRVPTYESIPSPQPAQPWLARGKISQDINACNEMCRTSTQEAIAIVQSGQPRRGSVRIDSGMHHQTISSSDLDAVETVTLVDNSAQNAGQSQPSGLIGKKRATVAVRGRFGA